ncbi:cytochrome P450 [Phytohabitans rumicis]|uniref:Cytochrome P450 n=1 Tax=Phytohabitans rumicis TaxID=1076125 RepID=A0A6V8LNU9_9ACTN|nr:cytochrome P450 [Phytohabitans rumicis]GFJ96548.1 cytochrome P450 [Phytohabitans rumicis]
MNRYPADRSCPYEPPEQYARWREAEPVTRVVLPSGAAAWLVTRYADVRRLLRDPALASDSTRPGYPRFGAAVEVPPLNRTFIGLDGPAHRRLRRMFADAFAVPAVARFEPRMTAIVDACLDDLAEGRNEPAGPAPGSAAADLVSRFALPVASRIICEVLGLGYEAHELFERSTHVLTDGASTGAQKAAAGAAIIELVADLVRERLRHPRADLASRIATRHVRAGELSEPEAVHNLALVLGAGHHTSANMISLGALALLREPAWADRFRGEPQLRANATEELLRYLTIVQLGLARVATADIAVGDRLVRAGDGVVLSVLAANRDARRFAGPDRLDLARADARHHLAFGFGPHQCVGHFLARTTVRVALARLVTRLPGLRLAGTADLSFTEATDFHGLHRLPVTW